MKKATWLLLSITAVFIAVLLGMFIGKNFAKEYVSLSDAYTTSAAVAAEETATAAQDSKLNINTATLSQLTMLPGIGEVLAQNIIDYRQAYGPFTAPEDLLLVEGIGEKRLDEIREYITLGG